MTIMEYGRFRKDTGRISKGTVNVETVTQREGKDVGSLRANEGGWASSPSVIATDAVPASTSGYFASGHTPSPGRHHLPESGPFSAPPTHGWLKKPKREPQEDTDLSLIPPKDEENAGEDTQEQVVGGASWLPGASVNPDTSPFDTSLHVPSYQPARYSMVDQARGDVYNFDHVHNVQLSENSTMVVNVFPRRTSPHRPRPKKRYTITNSKRILSNSNMEMLSSRLGKHWKFLARRLGFHDGDIDRLEYDYGASGLREVVWRMLNEWRERNAEAATLCAIADELIALRLFAIAEDLKEDG